MPRRSIGFPLAIGITLMVLALLLGIGWQVLVVGDLGPHRQVALARPGDLLAA